MCLKKKSQSGFVILTVYIDDLNIIKIPKELSKVIEYLKKEFEIKYLEFFFCHCLQISI